MFVCLEPTVCRLSNPISSLMLLCSALRSCCRSLSWSTRTRSGRRSRKPTMFVATSATIDNKFRRSSSSHECADSEPQGRRSSEAELFALQLQFGSQPFVRRHAYLAVCFVTTSMQKSCAARSVSFTKQIALSNHSASWRSHDHACCNE